MVMTGRLHKGDENGDTQYAYASLVLRSKIAYYGHSNTAPSLEIEESGKDKKRRFVFTCPENNVIIGQMHEGDENGHTYYKHAEFYFNNNLITTENHKWSDWVQESGKKSKGLSEFICPLNTVITGREHSGDENGETRYRYSEIFMAINGNKIKLFTTDSFTTEKIKESSANWSSSPENKAMTGRYHKGDENGDTNYTYSFIYQDDQSITTENHKWSDWVQESGKKSKGLSEFICPLNTVITGREHSGDENGETRYRYSEIFIDGVPCATYNNHWSAEKKESSGEWALAKNCEVMTGRRHEGDENGQSKYQFSSIGVSPTVTDSVKVNKAEHYV